jgi:hypothetical protein
MLNSELRREQRREKRRERILIKTAAQLPVPTVSVKNKNSSTLFSILENPDMKAKILSNVIENKSNILNKKTLQTIILQHTNMQYFDKLSKLTNHERRELLIASFHNIKNIIIDDYIFDINSIKILKYAIIYSPLESILLSNISFKNNNTCSIFADIFNNNIENVKSKIIHLVLKKIDLKKEYFNIFINSIGKLEHLELLQLSNINIQNLFTSIASHVGFDFMFMKILIKLKNLKDLIFTNNIINKTDYIYLFNEYYDFNHGYIIIDKDELDYTYVKYNIIRDPNPEEGEYTSEYLMRILEINSKNISKSNTTECMKSQYLHYYTRGNKYFDSKYNENLKDYVNDDFIDIIDEMLAKLNCDNPNDIIPFMLSS